jgi:hypothetical protein
MPCHTMPCHVPITLTTRVDTRWDTEQNPQVWTNCADITVL